MVDAGLWTLEELTAQAALALGSGAPLQASGRVREIPDERTIRYYTTSGLLDRPAELRGRTAYYGRRHLLQLVAVKRLQAKGLALAEIQQRLYGATNATLERAAQLGKPDEEPPRRAFWREAAPAPAVKQVVELAPGLELLVAGRRAIEPDDVEALRAASATLRKVLERRNLLAAPEEPS